MKSKNQALATVRRYFVWGDGARGPEIPLPQYDVSGIPAEKLDSLASHPRLRKPGHMPSIRSLEGSDDGRKRFVIRREGSATIAVALDQDIRKELVAVGAKPLKRAYLHPIR